MATDCPNPGNPSAYIWADGMEVELTCSVCGSVWAPAWGWGAGDSSGWVLLKQGDGSDHDLSEG